MDMIAFKRDFVGACLSVVGALSAVTNITENVTLQTDSDWRDRGQVTIAADVTVDLNGHKLKVAGLNCAVSIVDTGYRELAYIESTGKQWIDTEFVTTDQTAIDFDFTALSDNGNHAYFCGDWANWGHLFVINGGYINFFGQGGANTGRVGPTPPTCICGCRRFPAVPRRSFSIMATREPNSDTTMSPSITRVRVH